MENFGGNASAIHWFEIPVNEFERAKTFYETILQISMPIMDMGDPGMQMAVFAVSIPHIDGCIIKSDFHTPSSTGTCVYLNGEPDLQLVLDRVEAAGGKIVMPKEQISPEYGFMGMFEDTEGNKVGLHSM